MGRLDGKVALVTGGAGGMGETHVRRFIAEGARVGFTDLLEHEGRSLADELGAAAAFWQADATREADWARVVSAVEERFGPIGVLVNNAGLVLRGPLETMDEDDYRRVIDANQVSTFLGMKAVIGSMRRAGGGSIVNISSVCGFVGRPETIAYTASKFAVRGMSKVAAVELALDRIRVNSVHPGPILTPMFEGMAQAVQDSVVDAVPMKRLASPAEITSLVLFLASDESSYCTGAEFVADGGLIAQ